MHALENGEEIKEMTGGDGRKEVVRMFLDSWSEQLRNCGGTCSHAGTR